MKKNYFLLSFVLLVGVIGCVPRTVIVKRTAPPAPPPIFADTVIVLPPEPDMPPAPKRSPHQKYEHATTPLIYAISVNNLKDVQHLLSRGENPDEIFYSAQYEAAPLQEAVKRGNILTAKILLEHGANINLKANDKTAIEMAVRKNDLNMTIFLVSNGAYIFAANILEDSVRERDTAVLKYLLDNGAAKRSVPSARRGADYALIKACRLGNIEAMRLLIKAGANVEVIDSKGRGLLFYAAESANAAVLEFVFPYNQRMLNAIDDDGFTPLMAAVQRNNMHGVKFLITKGAYIDVQNKKSFTVIHYSKNAEMTKFLNENAPKHKKPSGYIMRRELTSKYDDYQAKPDTKPQYVPPERTKREDKPQTPKEDKRPFEQTKPQVLPAKTEIKPAARPSSSVEQAPSQNVRQNVPSRPSSAAPAAVPKTVEQINPVAAARTEEKPVEKTEIKPAARPASDGKQAASQNVRQNVSGRPSSAAPAAVSKTVEQITPAAQAKPAQAEEQPVEKTEIKPAARPSSSVKQAASQNVRQNISSRPSSAAPAAAAVTVPKTVEQANSAQKSISEQKPEEEKAKDKIQKEKDEKHSIKQSNRERNK